MITKLDRLTSISITIIFLLSLTLTISTATTAHSETVILTKNDTQQLRTRELAKSEMSGTAVIKADKNTGLVIQDGNAKLILDSGRRDEVRDFNQRLMMSQRTDNPRPSGIAVKFGIDF